MGVPPRAPALGGSVLPISAIPAILFAPHLLIDGGEHKLEDQWRHERALCKVLEEGIVLRVLRPAFWRQEATFAVRCNQVFDDGRAESSGRQLLSEAAFSSRLEMPWRPPLAHDYIAISQGGQVARWQCSRQACSNTSRYHRVDAVRALFLLALCVGSCLFSAGRARNAKGGSPRRIALGEARTARLCACPSRYVRKISQRLSGLGPRACRPGRPWQCTWRRRDEHAFRNCTTGPVRRGATTLDALEAGQNALQCQSGGDTVSCISRVVSRGLRPMRCLQPSSLPLPHSHAARARAYRRRCWRSSPFFGRAKLRELSVK